MLSLLFGWWGIPMGILYTALALVTNLSGGCDVTDEVSALLREQDPVEEQPEDPTDVRIEPCEPC
jgi:hypothetical protein